jgi:hypothetical protein
MKKQVVHVRIFLSRLEEEIRKQRLVLQNKQDKIIVSRTLNRIGTPVGIANIGFAFEKNEKFETSEMIIVDGVLFKILLPCTIGIDRER